MRRLQEGIHSAYLGSASLTSLKSRAQEDFLFLGAGIFMDETLAFFDLIFQNHSKKGGNFGPNASVIF